MTRAALAGRVSPWLGRIEKGLIESTLSLSHLAGTFKSFKHLVRAQRYLILLGPDEKGEFVVAHAEGLEASLAFTSEPLSMSILSRVVETRRPFLSERESDLDFDSNTCLLAGIKSVLCVPILGNQGQVLGLAYADDRQRAQAFQFTDLLNLQNLVKALHTQSAPAPARTPVKSTAAPKGPTPLRGAAKVALNGREEVLFLLQLSTFIRAGIPLISGLEAMSADSGRLGEAAQRVQRALLLGNSLAYSMQEQAEFSALTISMLRCAERSGQLALSLELLAKTLEKQRQRQLALQSSLAYPFFLMLASLGATVLVPGFVLKGHMEFYQAQKMVLPGLSLALLRWGQFLSHPLSWVGTAVLLISLGWLVRRRGSWIREKGQRLALKLPGLGGLALLYWECRFLHCLHLLLSPGVELLESIRLAAEGTGSCLWRDEVEDVQEEVRRGEPLSAALAQTGLTHRSTAALLVAGEESGKTVDSLVWIARLHELELDQSVEAFSKALEPLILLVMGIVVGFITVASLLPSIRYIQDL